jgi:surface polysaccharide O-acyltransferase-like enzyme
MLRKVENTDHAATTAERIVPLDRARTFITLLVVVHHSVVNYTYFGHGDRMRWLGFDLIVLFNDSFFMACMFMISGLFVCQSLTRRGPDDYLRKRGLRLGLPFLVSIFILMPIAYYPTFLRYHLPGTTDFNFLHFWWHTLTVGPWPSGPAWFLWVLLAFDVIVGAFWAGVRPPIEALGRVIFTLREQPMKAFAAFVVFSILVYTPMRLLVGDAAWFDPDGLPIPIQTSRILLYAGYFLVGVGIGAVPLRAGILKVGGAFARFWAVWLGFALAFYGGIIFLVYVHHNWVTDFDSPPLLWRAAYGLAFAMFSAAMAFTVPAVALRSAPFKLKFLDAMQPSAYGIFLLHYIFIIWLQYAVYDPPLPVGIKFAIVFTGTLSISWGLTLLLRKIPFVARLI